MTTRSSNMLLNFMLVISFLIMMWRLEDSNILVTLLSFLGFMMFVILKILITLRQKKGDPPK
ncbi:hypothetical protein [Rufibacter roseus]|uniref:Uncharacterized protein n=1 Tax=Rufibacter roseus TaxID=1567108 RepID=A0ABW2DGU1_9BACT|nr:hypothetical protein [Rufibacter roseus]